MLESTLAPGRKPLFRSSEALPEARDKDPLERRKSELMNRFEQLISEASEPRRN
jgi:hypothetical protein